jgi:hypothetical protein
MSIIDSAWTAYRDGTTLGTAGSEEGVILADEEHKDGARITLEQNCAHRMPFAITCGIYGWMVHTRFLDAEDDCLKEYAEMKRGLSDILSLIPEVDEGDEFESRLTPASRALEAFISRFP